MKESLHTITCSPLACSLTICSPPALCMTACVHVMFSPSNQMLSYMTDRAIIVGKREYFVGWSCHIIVWCIILVCFVMLCITEVRPQMKQKSIFWRMQRSCLCTVLISMLQRYHLRQQTIKMHSWKAKQWGKTNMFAW